MTIMDDIDADMKALDKLEKAAKKNTGVILSACEAKQIQDHIEWLANERESLFNSGAFDDD
jgi:hypothetical protein